MNTTVTFAGNLVEDPELRFTTNGTPVGSFRVAVNRRTKNTAGDWVDAPATFHNVKVWGQPAENTLESLSRGDRVLVHGQVETEAWDHEGKTYTKDVVVVSDRYGEIGTSLKYATAVPKKATRASRTTTEQQVTDQALADNVRQLVPAGPKPTEPPF